jgi:HEPN domain-containing protein
MPHDPARVAEVRAWLVRAAEDLRAADHELTASPPILGDLFFHCQQATEKLFKAFLVWHDVVFRKTHNLEELGEQCLAIDPTLREVVDRAVPLTEYAWRFRYPGEPDAPTDDEARDALASARAVREAITTRLPSEIEPPPGRSTES